MSANNFGDSGMHAVLSKQVVIWRFKNTGAAKLLGDERAMIWFHKTSGSPLKVLINILFSVTMLALSLIGLTVNGLELLSLCAPLHLLFLIMFTLFRADLTIAWKLVKQFRFIVDVLIASIANVAMITVVNYDIRVSVFIWFFFVIIWVEIIESYAKFILLVLRKPIMFAGIGYTFVLTVISFLGIIPNQNEFNVYDGDFGGLAKRNITMSNLDVASNLYFSLFILILSDFMHTLRHPEQMLRLALPVYKMDDPTDVRRFPEFMRGAKERMVIVDKHASVTATTSSGFANISQTRVEEG
jgi:hypothetical protein